MKLYAFDYNGVYAGAVEITDIYAPVPPGTEVAPPATSGTQVAQWGPAGWVVLDAYPAPHIVPPPVSPRQIRQALTSVGLRAQVEAAVAAGDQNSKDWYAYATAFERTNPHVIAMGVALGVSETQLDDLFKLAVTL